MLHVSTTKTGRTSVTVDVGEQARADGSISDTLARLRATAALVDAALHDDDLRPFFGGTPSTDRRKVLLGEASDADILAELHGRLMMLRLAYYANDGKLPVDSATAQA